MITTLLLWLFTEGKTKIPPPINGVKQTAAEAGSIGIDVMKVALPGRHDTYWSFVPIFAEQLTPLEQSLLIPPPHIRKSFDTSRGLEHFYWIWTLKEAVTKALGIGLGFDFSRIEFDLRGTGEEGGEAHGHGGIVRIDGTVPKGWKFTKFTQVVDTGNDKHLYVGVIAEYMSEDFETVVIPHVPTSSPPYPFISHFHATSFVEDAIRELELSRRWVLRRPRVESTDLVLQCSKMLCRKPRLLRDINSLLKKRDAAKGHLQEQLRIICRVNRPEVDCVVAVYAKGRNGESGSSRCCETRTAVIHAISPEQVLHAGPIWSSQELEEDAFWSRIQAVGEHWAPYVMELLQHRLESDPVDSSLRRKLIQCMRLLNKRHEALPPSIVVHDITREGQHPITGGGFADIWKGRRNGRLVCLKVLRIFTSSSDRSKLFKDLSNEVLIWKQLHHQHILPLYGVNMELFQPSYCIISPWMSNGDIGSFLRKSASESSVDRKIGLITEIAEGLNYLHGLDPPVIHGDIKGSNVLISDDLHCRLADFGLSMIETQTQSHSITSSANNRGSIRWLAPELINPDSVHTDLAGSKTRDIYAFACTIVEVLTGRPPFPEYKMDLHVMIQVLKGNRPARPSDCSDEVWTLIQRCWSERLTERLSAVEVVKALKSMCSPTVECFLTVEEEEVEVKESKSTVIPNHVPSASPPSLRHAARYTVESSIPVIYDAFSASGSSDMVQVSPDDAGVSNVKPTMPRPISPAISAEYSQRPSSSTQARFIDEGTVPFFDSAVPSSTGAWSASSQQTPNASSALKRPAEEPPDAPNGIKRRKITQTMSSNEFFANESSGSWADEMDSLPTSTTFGMRDDDEQARIDDHDRLLKRSHSEDLSYKTAVPTTHSLNSELHQNVRRRRRMGEREREREVSSSSRTISHPEFGSFASSFTDEAASTEFGEGDIAVPSKPDVQLSEVGGLFNSFGNHPVLPSENWLGNHPEFGSFAPPFTYEAASTNFGEGDIVVTSMSDVHLSEVDGLFNSSENHPVLPSFSSWSDPAQGAGHVGEGSISAVPQVSSESSPEMVAQHREDAVWGGLAKDANVVPFQGYSTSQPSHISWDTSTDVSFFDTLDRRASLPIHYTPGGHQMEQQQPPQSGKSQSPNEQRLDPSFQFLSPSPNEDRPPSEKFRRVNRWRPLSPTLDGTNEETTTPPLKQQLVMDELSHGQYQFGYQNMDPKIPNVQPPSLDNLARLSSHAISWNDSSLLDAWREYRVRQTLY
ncbi:hypothetical protein D9758_001463 [Tetrapyrgos nigripes]|uniref:Protein kinase domain-containing protein n=1 Tax=Tetrapyrgos nigripes TaxID=182062 RepID=A0A8H5GXQ0_9AGAR|nr:hypothetical protein D9758_001463 [Tetrapyrgos nigripes]